MPTIRTIFLPDRRPVTIDTTEWRRVGIARYGDLEHGGDGHGGYTETSCCQIDVYEHGGRYIVAGNRHSPPRLDHDTARLVDTKDAAELSVDVLARRILIQALLNDLTPDPLGES